MENVKFVMVMGLPASGKSTFSKELEQEMILMKEKPKYISSDKIREKKYGDESIQGTKQEANIMFEEIRKEIVTSLNDGVHVIFDATNINRKKRKHLLSLISKNKRVEKIIVYMATSYEDVVNNNNKRSRVVPLDVINRMYKTAQVPLYSEGWDKILIEHGGYFESLPYEASEAVREAVLTNADKYGIMTFLATYFTDFFKVYDMAQDSKYHSFSVSRHIYHVYEYIHNNYNGDDKEVLLWSSLLHDVGKHFCKSFYNRKGEESKYANFIGHENVGWQIAVTILRQLNFQDSFILEVATLVDNHMKLLNKDMNVEKLKRIVGQYKYEQLLVLRDADTKSH